MEENNARGLTFSEALTVALIVLKLCNVITTSWLWVLSPLWISIILYSILYVIKENI